MRAAHRADHDEGASEMATATRVGQAGLQGWRKTVADGVAAPVAKRTSLDEQQIRALVGAAFFALAVSYVIKSVRTAAGRARSA
jgi:hypothetical protein